MPCGSAHRVRLAKEGANLPTLQEIAWSTLALAFAYVLPIAEMRTSALRSGRT